MAPTPLQQRKTHNTLLFQKLLNLRDGASPFTLILDTLEQSSGPVVREFARRAKISKSKIIFISYTTLRQKIPFSPDVFISAWGKALSALRAEIISHLPLPPTTAPMPGATKYLLIIDTLSTLSTHPEHLTPFLTSLLPSPLISLLATYHADIPLPSPSTEISTYTPPPLQTLLYLSTSILILSSLPHTIARKKARDKSLSEPVFGLSEGREGVIFGLKKGGPGVERGVVVNMEIRRRSGRGILEDFVLIPPSAQNSEPQIMLLSEHPLYITPTLHQSTEERAEGAETETTFSLNLTEKQKRDRENVVLPYFDAQKEGGAMGPGEGGRILYEMGEEDREDFDDEEDEI